MRQIWAIISKDLLIERRAWSRLMALFGFAVMMLLLFSFAVGPNSTILQKHAAGYLWLAAMFTSSMLFSESFQREMESGALASLILIPVSGVALFYGKAIANALQLIILMMAILPPLFAICDLQLVEGVGWLMLTIGLGAFGLAAPGALYAAMTSQLSSQQLLLPLFLFPLMIPALLAAVKCTALILSGDPMDQISSWLSLLVAFDAIYWSLCGVLFGKVIEL